MASLLFLDHSMERCGSWRTKECFVVLTLTQVVRTLSSKASLNINLNLNLNLR